MTQRDNGHDYRDSKNKAEAFDRQTKTKNALKLLNSNINKLDKLKSNDDAYIDPVTVSSIDSIIDDLTDVFVDLKIQTGVDV
jgi:hypothetical protein|tara:strand:- start:80 stop:325 length:246 start_codon:yes stop_codon:yes gene_type:complete